jgi:hypothetical protein
VKVNQRFGGTYRRNRQGKKVSQARNEPEAGSTQMLVSIWPTLLP